MCLQICPVFAGPVTYIVVINTHVATYYRMLLCYLPVVQDINWCQKSLGSFLFKTSESLDHYNYLC